MASSQAEVSNHKLDSNHKLEKKHKDGKENKEKTDMKEKKEKEKKAKSEKKRSDTDGVHKDKKDRKKDRKKDKAVKKMFAKLVEDVLEDEAEHAKEKFDKAEGRRREVEAEAESSNALVSATSPGKSPGKIAERVAHPEAKALVKEIAYFALPFANPEQEKEVLELVALASSVRAVQRGLNESNKALKRLPVVNPALKQKEHPDGLVILAGDINPGKVIEHFPIVCEDRDVPYIFIESRRDLGAAASTKRSSCVVFLTRDSKPAPQSQPGQPKREPAEGDGVVMVKGDGKAATHGNRKSKHKGPKGEQVKLKLGNADQTAEVEVARPEPKVITPEELAAYQAHFDKVVKFTRKAWKAQVYPYVKGTQGAQMAGCTIATA